MAGSLGAVSCSFVRAVVPPAGPRTEVWTVPGLSGHGVLYLGSFAAEIAITASFISSVAGVTIWEAAVYALQGTTITITADDGNVYTNCLVREIGPAKKSSAYNAGIGTEQRADVELKILRVGA